MSESDIIQVLVAGLPGNMSSEVAELIVQQDDMELAPDALKGLGVSKTFIRVGEQRINLAAPEFHEALLQEEQGKIVVDFTLPTSVNFNAELYCDTGHHFVMGTTGGDREALTRTVQKSDVCAVIDVNMAAPIVVLRAMLEWAAKTFPGSLSGLKLGIVERHQRAKKDVSGTAIAFQGIFETLGAKMAHEICSIRDREEAHGHHKFTLSGPGFNMEFVTQVDGREIYAQGTLTAIRFLKKKMKAGERGRVFTMIDVLKGDS